MRYAAITISSFVYGIFHLFSWQDFPYLLRRPFWSSLSEGTQEVSGALDSSLLSYICAEDKRNNFGAAGELERVSVGGKGGLRSPTSKSLRVAHNVRRSAWRQKQDAPGFRVSRCSPGMTGVSFSSFQPFDWAHDKLQLESREVWFGLDILVLSNDSREQSN
jgi:hypothetical protein